MTEGVNERAVYSGQRESCRDCMELIRRSDTLYVIEGPHVGCGSHISQSH